MPGRQQLAYALLVFGMAAASPAEGQSLDERLLREARHGRLEKIDFLTACLIAGGTTDECELDGWRARLTEIESNVLDGLPQPPLDRLCMLHRRLHRRVLQGEYSRQASDLRVALGAGNYNCLSATALFYAVAKSAGLKVVIRLERGHVNLEMTEADEAIVIEPSASQVRLHAASSTARTLTPIELIAKFYYNRGVEHLQDQQFEAGLSLLAKGLRLDPDDHDARLNMVAGINNWAAAQCAAGKYDRAAQLITAGLRLDPNFAPLIANQQLVRGKLGAR